jgi:iron complex outermembrane receptor protein
VSGAIDHRHADCDFGAGRVMMRFQSCRAAVSPLAFASVLCAGPALAQDGPAAAPAPAPESPTIVVTGSLIGGPAEDAPAPVDVIDAEELARQGSPSILDLTRRLPVSSGVLADSSQFDGRSQFADGSASINLRGLGPQRTLVLLNGRRIASSGAASQPFVDLNLLPIDALARIEILKDGAAATYGSDAIAGVVNIITRTRQQGFEASAAYRHIDGSEGDWNAGLSWGGTFGPARLFVSGGYQRRHELQVLDREGLVRPYPENPQGGYSGGGNPGNFDYNATLGGIAFTADEGCEGLGGFRSLPGSSDDLCQVNYLGFTNLIEPEERYQLFADAELELGDRATLRLTGLYGRTATELNTSPTFLPTIAPSSAAAFGGTGLFVMPTRCGSGLCWRGAIPCSTMIATPPPRRAIPTPTRRRRSCAWNWAVIWSSPRPAPTANTTATSKSPTASWTCCRTRWPASVGRAAPMPIRGRGRG